MIIVHNNIISSSAKTDRITINDHYYIVSTYDSMYAYITCIT